MSLLLLFPSSLAGPVSADFNVVEADDTLATSIALDLIGKLAITEPDDVATATGAITITASAVIIEGDDSLSASVTLAIIVHLTVTEGDDVPSTAGTLDIVATVAVVEDDDSTTTSANLIVSALLGGTEEDDTLSADALVPIWYPRHGGDDAWAQYERRQIEWEQQLRRIINRSWQIVHGEIDPITLLPIQPPDYSAVIDELIGKVKALHRTRVEAFIAEQEQLQKEEAISILLIAA